VIWARRGLSLTTCPKSYITAESLALVEEFVVRRRLGAMDLTDLSARQVEAFAVLEKAVISSRNDGQHNAESTF
jgi:hypothetical protein